MRVVIAGGGIGGLCAAIALKAAGIEVLVFERAGQDREVGAGLQITPNATRLLERAGLMPALLDAATQTQANVMRNWQDDAVLSRLPLGSSAIERFGAPLLHFHRAHLVHALGAALPYGTVTTGLGVAGFQDVGSGVEVSLSDGSTVSADALLGADGYRSPIRQSIVPGSTPVFSGKLTYRGLIAAERMREEASRREMAIWFGPGAHVVQSFAGPGYLNVGLIVTGPENPERSAYAEASPDDVLDHVVGWSPMVREILANCDSYLKWPMYDIDPIPTYHRGRVAVLGDAAHAMLPFMAQGASQAVEDAFVVAATLARNPGDIESGLAEYSARRVPRTHRIQAGARANSQLFHLDDEQAQEARNAQWADADANGDSMPFRDDPANWVYAYDAETDVAAATP